MRNNAFLLLVLLLLPAFACRAGSAFIGETIRGSGNVIEETRQVSGISSVELATTGTLHIELGQSEELRIEAEANLIPYILSEVHGDHLKIDTAEGVNIQKTKTINYYLTVVELDAITISSSGDVIAPAFETDEFEVNIQSSGDLKIDGLLVDWLKVDINSSGDMTLGELKANRINVDINSSGDLEILAGSVKKQVIDINSSGDYKARNVESSEAGVDLSSSGSATIRVSESLDASLNSSGNVYYIGDPQVQERSNSSGRVIQIDE